MPITIPNPLSRAFAGLEPEVPYTSPVCWKILERIESVKVVNRQMRHHFGRREPKVYGHTAPTVLLYT